MLYGMKPRQAPTIMAVISAACTSPAISVTKSSEMEQMIETPQAKPSSPSMRLRALVSATIQMTVIMIDQLPKE